MNAAAEQELFYRIALTQTEFIGNKTARSLLQHFGSAREAFSANRKQLSGIDGFGEKKLQSFKTAIDERSIEKEIAFLQKHAITPLFLQDDDYPQRLKQCPDAPIMLFYKGNANLNSSKIVSIVGTRKPGDYGRQMTESLIEGFRGRDILILSGLALGIDGMAHQQALHCGLQTVGVVAHGLDTIYPSQHKKLAREMTSSGGILTEYTSGTVPDKYNFPMRNRIVAGMADITIVMETDIKGGAMITAQLAAGYNRDVAAFPGRAIDKKSAGCNYLIAGNTAQLVTNSEDVLEMMNWNDEKKPLAKQAKLFRTLTKEEECIVEQLKDSEGIHVDELSARSAISNSILASVLLSLELDNVVKALPGKRYRLL